MEHILTITNDLWKTIQSRLTDHNGCEHLFAGLLTINETPHRREFFLKEIMKPEQSDYMEQSSCIVTIDPEFMANLLLRSKHYSGILLMHNHIGSAMPSYIDNSHIQKALQNAGDFRNGNFIIRSIWGTDGIFAEARNAQMDEWAPIDFIKIIGDEDMSLLYPINTQSIEDNEIDEERHNRTLNLLGEHGHEVLKMVRKLKWGFIGAGGTMSCFIYTMKFLGPKRCVIVDGDRIERSNANRLFGYRYGDDQKYKGDVIQRELLAYDPDMQVEIVNSFFPSEEAMSALKDCDIIVCGPDNDFCRYHAAAIASRYWKVLLDFGSGIRLDKNTGIPLAIGSQARLQLPTRNGKCLACLGLETDNLINPKIEDEILQSSLQIGYIQDSDLPTPVSVVTINAVIAAIGVRMLLSYFSGIGKTPSYLIYDELGLQLRDVSSVFKKRIDCPLCGSGDSSSFGWGDDLPSNLKMMEPTEEIAEEILDVCV
jgi:molybdopterin/thiamine biosynthesis adenylyltransferase